MKFCRYVPVSSAALATSSQYGILEGGSVHEVSKAPWLEWQQTGTSVPLASVRLLAPVEPRKTVCVGRNYAAHAAELGNEVPKEPLIFLKPSTSIVGPDDPIILPKYSQRVEHEGELGLVIGRKCAHLSDTDDALSY